MSAKKIAWVLLAVLFGWMSLESTAEAKPAAKKAAARKTSGKGGKKDTGGKGGKKGRGKKAPAAAAAPETKSDAPAAPQPPAAPGVPGVVSATTAPSPVTVPVVVSPSTGPLPPPAGPALVVVPPAGPVQPAPASAAGPVLVPPLPGAPVPAAPVAEPLPASPVSLRHSQRLALGVYGELGANRPLYGAPQLRGAGGLALSYDLVDTCAHSQRPGCVRLAAVLPDALLGYDRDGKLFSAALTAGLRFQVALHSRVQMFVQGGVGVLLAPIGDFDQQEDAGVPAFAKRDPKDRVAPTGYGRAGFLFALKPRSSKSGYQLDLMLAASLQNGQRPYPGLTQLATTDSTANPSIYRTLNATAQFGVLLHF